MRRRNRGVFGGRGLRGLLPRPVVFKSARVAAMHGPVRGRHRHNGRRMRGAQDRLLPPSALPAEAKLHGQRRLRRVRTVRGCKHQRPGVPCGLVVVLPRRRHRCRWRRRHPRTCGCPCLTTNAGCRNSGAYDFDDLVCRDDGADCSRNPSPGCRTDRRACSPADLSSSSTADHFPASTTNERSNYATNSR